MKQDKTNILAPIDNSRSGLVSLEALELATAQLPVAKRNYRVTIVCCDSSSDEADVQALMPDTVAVAN